MNDANMSLRSDPVFEEDTEVALSAEELAERRRHGRSMRVMRVARLAALDTEGFGMVRDVSPGGMMIDANFDLDIGQTVSVALLDDQELTGTIAWKDGNMLGIQFAEEIPVDEILAKPSVKPDGKRARHPRFAVQKEVQLKLDTTTADAVLHDISQRGAKLKCAGRLKVHSNLLLRAEGQRPVGGTIKWRAGDMIGVEFHRLLSVDELEQWLSFNL
jgi:hypothetical protein